MMVRIENEAYFLRQDRQDYHYDGSRVAPVLRDPVHPVNPVQNPSTHRYKGT